jgi:hypothetical protein
MQLLQAVLKVLAAAAATGEDGEPVAAGTAELGPTAGAVGSSCWRTLAGRYRGSMGLTDADEVNITAVGPPGSDSAKYVANSYSGFRNLNIVAFANDTISGKIAKDVFARMIEGEGEAADIVEKHGLKQVTDTGAIEKVVDEIIAANPEQVAHIKEKPKTMGWFVGQVMKASGGKANPKAVNDILKAKLGL